MSRTLLAVLIAFAMVVVVRPAVAGYTHYWTWKKTPTAAQLEPCLADMEKVVAARREILADGAGKTGKEAVFRGQAAWDETSTLPSIAFNGVGDDAHETFAFPLAAFAGQPSFSFVKTQWKPYDEVVVACLIVARDHFAEDALEIRSDGQWNEEWVAGAKLYEQVLHRPPRNPLPPADEDFEAADPTLPTAARETGSVRRNLLISAVVFGALVIFVVLSQRRGRE